MAVTTYKLVEIVGPSGRAMIAEKDLEKTLRNPMFKLASKFDSDARAEGLMAKAEKERDEKKAAEKKTAEAPKVEEKKAEAPKAPAEKPKTPASKPKTGKSK